MGCKLKRRGWGKVSGGEQGRGEGPVTLRRTLPSGDRVGKQEGHRAGKGGGQ